MDINLQDEVCEVESG